MLNYHHSLQAVAESACLGPIDGDTVEPVLLHNIRQDTSDAVRQVYAVQPEMQCQDRAG
jgi:hypothetical protein